VGKSSQLKLKASLEELGIALEVESIQTSNAIAPSRRIGHQNLPPPCRVPLFKSEKRATNSTAPGPPENTGPLGITSLKAPWTVL
jgi:hypothetical protein